MKNEVVLRAEVPVAAADLLERNGDPTEDEIRAALKGNVCRCTGYHNIVKSIQAAAAAGA